MSEVINLLDCFSGIGGFSLAAKRAGFKIKNHYSSEIDKYAQWIYRKQFPGSVQLGDVTGIGNDLEKIDILTGGFPCQSFSIAGKRRGFEDTRGTLFFEIERLTRFYRPTYMVLENVKGLFSHDGGNTIRVILDKLGRLDYSVQLLLLNTVDFGIPQNRERCFFICTSGGKRKPEISGIREAKKTTPFSSNTIDANYWKGIDNHGARTCIEVGTKRGESKDGQRIYSDQGAYSCLKAVGEMNAIQTKVYQRCFSNQYSEKIEEIGTLQASRIDKVPMITDKTIIRRLTPIECERLQDYPDDWTKLGATDNSVKIKISDTQRYKTLGNSITVKVAEEIFKTIKEAMNV